MLYFITGNQNKADHLARYLGYPIEHKKLDLEEIQSLDVSKVAEHKARQAWAIMKQPVVVEDVSLEFHALGNLPGPFVRFFEDNVPWETQCRMLDGMDRRATGRCVISYCDGGEVHSFEGSIEGRISEHPGEGDNGWGWDKIFIPEGFEVTRAQLSDADYRTVYTKIKPFPQLKAFLEQKR